MKNFFKYHQVLRILLYLILFQLTACGNKANLSDKSGAEVIEKQVLEKIFNMGIPIGSIVFGNQFEAAMSNDEMERLNNIHNPRRLEFAKGLAKHGLLSLKDKTSAFDIMHKKFDISLTPKGEKEVYQKNNGMVYFKLCSINIERVVSNTLISDKQSDIPEPKRLIMAEFTIKETELGEKFFGKSVDDKGSKIRVRAILKYDNFDKKWNATRFDVADNDGKWSSNNVEM